MKRRPSVAGLATMTENARTHPPASEISKFHSLAEIARLINSSSDLPALLNRIVLAVCQHSSWTSCGIMGVNRKAQLSELIVRFDPRLDPATNPPTSWKLEQSATMRVIETNRPVIIEDAQVCDEFLAYKEDSLLRGYRTVVILPLGNTDQLGREMTIAVHSREKNSVSESQLAFLSTVTQLASIAVEKAKRVRVEQDLAQRLRQTIEISSQLMERVLAEGSMETVIEVVAAVVPFPLIIADLAAGTFSVRRTPLPKLIGERKWRRLVEEELAPAIADLVRTSAMGGGKTRGVLAVSHDAMAATLHPVVEPLQVHNETLGGLIIFPSGDRLDDLDAMVVQAAKLALNVQFMRDHVRFRSEANSLAEVFQTLFAGAPRHPSELVARARRLNVSLPGPARLIAIGFPHDGLGAGEPQSSGLHLTLARCAAGLRPGAAVVVDDDLIVFAPVSPKEEPALWDQFTSAILAAVESHAGTRPVAAVSRLCRRLADYREARLECGRTLTLARMFGKTGLLSQADFGPFAVLLSAVDQPSARDFVRHTLGAIEEHDARHGGELLYTLMEFVRDSCRYQACADRLGIHVSTLRYRVQRMQELFAINFDHPDSLFGLALALRLRDLAGDAPRSGSANSSNG
jgi:DNA-binding PucR family transcriptional regulator